MAPKHVVAVLACAITLALGAPALADEYRAGEVFNLDLSKAVLSPKRIGPPAEFVAVPVEARTDTKQAVAEPKAERQHIVRTTRVLAPRVTGTQEAKPRGAARTKLAHRRNPLDAQAMDTRTHRSVQTWPCKSGGICAWKR
jgi:hypothetical protein